MRDKEVWLRRGRLAAIAIGIIAVIVIIVLVVVNALRSAELDIVVTPMDAKITVNGHEYKNGHYRTFPGKVTVKISAEGFQTEEFELELSAHKNSLIHRYLLDENGSFMAYTKHSKDYDVLKMFAEDEKVSEFISEYSRAIKIRDILPIHYYYEGNNASMSQSVSALKDTTIKDVTDDDRCKGSICIEVGGKKKDRAAAEKVLAEYGYDINYIEVFYEE